MRSCFPVKLLPVKYPIEALKTMVKIARRTEADVEYNQQFSVRTKDDTTNVTTAISHATCMTAIDLNAKAIIAVTRSGNTARMVSKYRPGCQIIACTPDERTWRQLNMVWGVAPILTKEEYSMEILLLHATEAAEEKRLCKKRRCRCSDCRSSAWDVPETPTCLKLQL